MRPCKVVGNISEKGVVAQYVAFKTECCNIDALLFQGGCWNVVRSTSERLRHSM